MRGIDLISLMGSKGQNFLTRGVMVIIQMVIIKNLFLLVLTWFDNADLSPVLAIGFVSLSLYSARNVLYSKFD